MKILVVGGSKSGKSEIAEEIAKKLAGGKKCIYIATMMPVDDEDIKRIDAHVERRAADFDTVECGRDISSVIKTTDPGATVLLDSVTTLHANEFFPRENNFLIDEYAPLRCKRDLLELANSVKNIVFVIDDIFSDAVRYDETTEAFRHGLGYIGSALASECDEVIEAKFGIKIKLK